MNINSFTPTMTVHTPILSALSTIDDPPSSHRLTHMHQHTLSGSHRRHRRRSEGSLGKTLLL